MTGTETANRIAVKLLRDGFVFANIARKVGDEISVDAETFRHLLGLGFVKERIRVRALRANVLANDRTLAEGEVGTAPSEVVAIERYLAGDWSIENPSALSSALPRRRPQRERVRVIGAGLINGDVDREMQCAKIHPPGAIVEVPTADVGRLVKQGFVERLKKMEPEKEAAPKPRGKVRAVKAGQYGNRWLAEAEEMEADLMEVMEAVADGRLVAVRDPAAADPGAPVEGKSKKPK